MSVRVLVTGSTGNLGRKAVAALGAALGASLREVGRNSQGRPEVVTARLETWDPTWAAAFEGCDVVLHLAADPRADAEWDSVIPLNIDMTLNVLRAARVAGVSCMVLASSNWVFAGYRHEAVTLDAERPPRPVTPYGASKVMAERAGLAWQRETGGVFVSLRIGYCQPGDNRPGPHMGFGLWGQQMWLGNEDWARAVVAACTAPASGGSLMNVVSLNEGMRWDLAEAGAAIGYAPRERHRPHLVPAGRLREAGVRAREALARRGRGAPAFGTRW